MFFIVKEEEEEEETVLDFRQGILKVLGFFLLLYSIYIQWLNIDLKGKII